MTMIVLLQALFSASLIMLTKVPATLKNNAYGLFAEKVQNRKNYLLSEMANRWSNITDFKTQIAKKYNLILGDGGNLSPDQTVSFLDQSTSILIQMMETSMSTGGFIILDDAVSDKGAQSGIYIRNYNPALNDQAASASNLVMLRGPVDVSKKYKIPLENAWSYGFTLDEQHSPILRQPLSATTLTTNDKYLGFWHVSPSLSTPNSSIITYSLPLIDQHGKAVGVIGVEISQDYLYKLLPSNEFAENESYGYLIAKLDNDTGDIIPLISQGTVQKSIATLNTPLPLALENKEFRCYSIDTVLGRISANYEEISLYSPNTPFINDHWLLIGLTAESNITTFSGQLNQTLLLMILWSLLVGALISYLVGYSFSRPIVRLGLAVKNSHLDGTIALGRTNIAEIDDLAVAIEQLSQNILNSVTKTDQIMEMVNMGVGSFEYQQGSPYVTVSSSLQRMLQISPVEHTSFSVSKDHFFSVLSELKTQPEEDIPDTYLFSTNPKCWYKLIEMEREGVLLGALINVTKDVLERYVLNYERDYDTLTGIYNRLAFHRKAQYIFDKENLQVAAITMFDLDNLKYVNDTYGHEMGDRYIKTAARMMELTFHTNALVARMSGDEFYVLFYGYNSKEEILNLLNQLYRTLDHEPITLPNGTQFKVRMSGGIAWYGEDSSDLDELIRFADFAMYEGKHTIKGELREFKRDVYLAESFLLNGKEELNRILDNQFIDFAFQPIVDAQTGALYAYEALMRPQSDLLDTPMKLIQIATAQSQLWQIEKITFFKALTQYTKYRDLFGDAKLFINSVPNQVLKPLEYTEFERLYADDLCNLVVEIIENERLNVDLFQQKLDRITSWGSKIALDDYGTGYNNDLSLLSIHPHIVKLDRFLIAGVDCNPTHQAIVDKVISFCKQNNMLVLAEGVETAAQLAYLVRAGVDLLQGYYIAKPMPMPNFDQTVIQAEIQSIQTQPLPLA